MVNKVWNPIEGGFAYTLSDHVWIEVMSISEEESTVVLVVEDSFDTVEIARETIPYCVIRNMAEALTEAKDRVRNLFAEWQKELG